ncbi:permease prefix domain 1-containing protein [Alteribacter natronophilus]|uniref:permease prefix domain 1-containing protein n=1 Tax=Alteribacter natronophilus TaxID=2583810 RepID=UPI00110E372E|nr:permease prefix domain 1-containing protein [Alteribacter natronophilus]TMW72822.1 hypothetical protein FGB90_00470 [Alteribacter natronophilus]
MKQIDAYLNRVYKNAEGEPEEIKDSKAEMRDHLLDKVQDYKDQGKSEQEAVNAALEDFGEEKQVTKGLAEFFYLPKARLLQKLLTALFSALVFSGAAAWIIYTPETQQMEGVAYFSFAELFLLYGAYSLAVFLFGGIPYSMILDGVVSKVKRRHRYPAELAVYTLGGIVVNVWFFISLFNPYGIVWDQAALFLFLGIAASLVFLHLSYIVKKILRM